MNIAGILLATGYDERSIHGALIGDGKRYKYEDALINIGLVIVREEDSYGQKITLFSTTSNGEDVEKILSDYERKHSTFERMGEHIKQSEGKIWKK